MVEEAALVFQTPSVTCESTIGTDRAMARNHDCDGVGAVGVPDRARCGWASKTAGDFGVGARITPRDRTKLCPYRELKRCGTEVQRQNERVRIFRSIGDDALGVSSRGLVISNNRVGGPEISVQLRFEERCVVVNPDPAHAAGRRGGQNRSERRRGNRKGDSRAPSIASVGSLKHDEIARACSIRTASHITARRVRIHWRRRVAHYVHQPFGNFNTRSPMMLCWISLEPAAIVSARAESVRCIQRPPSTAPIEPLSRVP
jgi:hypothetical protein